MTLTRLIALGLALGALLGVAAWQLAPGQRPAGVHLSGDAAARLMSALGDAPRAPSPEAARVEIVALTDWAKLRHVPGAEALCGATCAAEPSPRLVRVLRLSPSGTRKVVLPRLGQRPVLAEDGPEPTEAEAACAEGAIAAEAAALLPAARPGCGPEVTLWALPGGLGVL